jgi:hypothetical protein
MAQKVTVLLVDDLDGTEAEDVSTVLFALDGVSYEIDLAEANAENLREILAEFVAAAKRTGGRVKRGARPATTSASSSEAHDIREWAAKNGIQLAPRGRIPNDIIQRYRDEQRAPKSTKTAAPAKKSTAKKPAARRTRGAAAKR